MKIRGPFTNIRNRPSFQFFSKRKRRHETRSMKSTWHQSSTEAVGLGCRILLEKVCCSHECRPVCRSSVFEHICSVLEKTGPTHIIGSKLFTTGWVSPVISAAPVSFCDPNMYLQRHFVSRSMEAVTIDTSWRSHHGPRYLSPSALNGNYYEYSLGHGRSWSDRHKPSLKPSIDVC